MDKFEVDNKAEYVPGWISYLSTAVGILRAVGEEVDLVEVGGYSGYAFHINTASNDTCPSAPTVAPFELFREGLEALGREVTFGWTGPSYTPSTDEKAIARAKEFFEDVKGTLTRTNSPIGIWGIPVPEFGIVNGFEEDKFLVSTFRGLESASREEEPIPYNLLHAPGGLSKLVVGKKLEHKDQRQIDKNALERAIRIASGVSFGEPQVDDAYVTGPDALTRWAEIIEKGKVPSSEEEYNQIQHESKLNYHGNSYVAACTKEGMDLAGSFLMRLYRRYKSEDFAPELEEASHQYKHAAEKMRIFTELFPFSMERNWKDEEFDDEKREVASQLLRDAQPHIISAIEHMQKALQRWN